MKVRGRGGLGLEGMRIRYVSCFTRKGKLTISELFGWFETRGEKVTVNLVSDCYRKQE